MDAGAIIPEMGSIKSEIYEQTEVINMPSCRFSQQQPVGNMVATTSIPRNKIFRYHIMKDSSSDLHLVHCRRKLDFNQNSHNYYGYSKPQTMSVARRNERERNRVKLINMTFATLREHLPNASASSKSKKMSKVDTLKAAIDYIKRLQSMVEDNHTVTSTIGSGYPTISIASPSTMDSPTLSSASDSSYEGLSAEEEDLLDFASWF
ncbi:hypothetical protein ACJMK2_030010 [Sinanodonta woodiana]|uniref:BHLH domain-containing protein n=1 Tax=Sinanodonta woodiana TaxID=1069815 RepID=A0ABD3XBX6_SINWO